MRAKLLSVAVLAVLGAGQVSADGIADAAKLNKKLQGRYATQQTDACVNSPAGFSAAPGLAALGPTTAGTAATSNITTFNGDGTLTLEGDGLQIGMKLADPSVTVTNPVTSSHFICNGTYQVNADDTYTTNYTCTGNVLTGVVPGLAFTLVGGHADGLIVNKKTVQFRQDTVSTEVISTIYGPVPRICSHTGTSTKLTKDKDNDNDE
jgi:hypothetical protein